MKIVTIVGARPQFIKAATISRVIQKNVDICEVMIHTGQHFDANMSDVFFDELVIRKPDYNLGIGGGTHGENTGRMIEAIEKILIEEKPDWVLVYGDTDSTLAGALATVKLHIKVAHVEAGLRSFNRQMPEEINRILTDHVSDLLLVPTKAAITNLENEGIKGEKVRLVGDVMFDASIFYRDRSRKPSKLGKVKNNQFILCTIHRAENTDNPERLLSIVKLLNELAKKRTIILPLHPRTFRAINRLGEQNLSSDIVLLEPVSYLEMTWLLANCNFVLTDSGGVQKEAYFFKKPCVTLRDETEWIELVEGGYNYLLPPSINNMIDLIESISSKEINFKSNLYGFGDAAENIIKLLNK